MALPIRTALLALIALLAVVWTLRATALVAIPVVASLLAALAVAPVSARIRRGVPPGLAWLGPVCATGLVVAVVLGLLGGLSIAAGQVIAIAPTLVERTLRLAESGGAMLVGASIVDPQQLQDFAARLIEPALSFTQRAMGAAASVTAGIVLMIFLTLLMLAEAPVWRRKAEALGHRRSWLGVLDEASGQLRRFMLTRLLLGTATGILYALWLSVFGIDLLLTWAMLALLLNFIPNIGSIVAGVLPALYAAATRDVGTALAVAAGLFAIEQVMGNYVDPKIMGKQLSLSSLVVLVSVLVWTWIWGAVGAILATPLTALLADLCRAVPSLRPLALLLGDRAEPQPETDPDRADR